VVHSLQSESSASSPTTYQSVGTFGTSAEHLCLTGQTGSKAVGKRTGLVMYGVGRLQYKISFVQFATNEIDF
jgi:hypothetical protein